jgi:cytochrome P450
MKTILFIVLANLLSFSVVRAELTSSEVDEFEHLSTGADIFPYDWFLRLKSARANELNQNWNTYFKDGLDQRASILYDQSHEFNSNYISGVKGLAVTWSGDGSKNQSALKSDPEMNDTQLGKKAPIRITQGKLSIRMLGTNCAACHTGSIKTDDHHYKIIGGQSNFSMDWLLKDMVVSTLSLFFDVDGQLAEFLQSFGYEHQTAKRLAKQFKKETLRQLHLKPIVLLGLNKAKLLEVIPTHTFVKDEKVISNRLKQLLRLTLQLDEHQELGNELEKRMDFIAMLVSGTPKKTFQNGHWTKYKEVDAGYGRVDAFNNAFNKLLRNKIEKINLSAAVGYPPIWGIQNKYTMHYTGNTNSVMNRNVGVTMAAGAVFLDENSQSTVHFDNLYRLENLMYKIDAPNWKQIFSKETDAQFKIKTTRVEMGSKLYQKNCASCHDPLSVHNEFKFPLYEYKRVPHQVLGTDPNLAINIVKPIRPLTDPSSYPASFYMKQTNGLIDAFFSQSKTNESKKYDYTFQEYRGDAWFKDIHADNSELTYVPRDLAGMWATAPFLHNNSVPTLWDLLSKPENRPTLFKVKDRKFDPVLVGLKDYNENLDHCYDKKGLHSDRYQCFNVNHPGNSNLGHDFSTDLTDEEKLNLIEYLKVIEPFAKKTNRSPSSVGPVDQTPFLNEFDNIKLGKLPVVGKSFYKNDYLKHRLLTFKKWIAKNPDDMFEELRTHRPIAFMSKLPIKNFNAPNTGIALISKHADIIEALENPSVFSARHVGYKLDPLGGYVLGTDETDFNQIEKPWLRRLIPKSDYERIYRLIGQYTEESFQRVESKQRENKTVQLNLVEDLGKRVPALLFENYFGFSSTALEKLYEWSYWIQVDTFRNPTNKSKVRKKALKSSYALLEEMNKTIQKLEIQLKQNQNRPIHDTVLERMILSDEVQTGVINKDRIAINMIGLIGASIDTIQIALVKSLEFFIKNPQQMQEARLLATQKNFPVLEKYIMESLRLNPATPMLLRYTEKDFVIAKGTQRQTLIPKGTSLLLGTYSAMRDTDVVNDPDAFKIDRPENNYFLFGYGHHKCAGDRLATTELSMMMAAILQKTNLRYLNLDRKKALLPSRRFIHYDLKL